MIIAIGFSLSFPNFSFLTIIDSCSNSTVEKQSSNWWLVARWWGTSSSGVGLVIVNFKKFWVDLK